MSKLVLVNDRFLEIASQINISFQKVKPLSQFKDFPMQVYVNNLLYTTEAELPILKKQRNSNAVKFIYTNDEVDYSDFKSMCTDRELYDQLDENGLLESLHIKLRNEFGLKDEDHPITFLNESELDKGMSPVGQVKTEFGSLQKIMAGMNLHDSHQIQKVKEWTSDDITKAKLWTGGTVHKFQNFMNAQTVTIDEVSRLILNSGLIAVYKGNEVNVYPTTVDPSYVPGARSEIKSLSKTEYKRVCDEAQHHQLDWIMTSPISTVSIKNDDEIVNVTGIWAIPAYVVNGFYLHFKSHQVSEFSLDLGPPEDDESEDEDFFIAQDEERKSDVVESKEGVNASKNQSQIVHDVKSQDEMDVEESGKKEDFPEINLKFDSDDEDTGRGFQSTQPLTPADPKPIRHRRERRKSDVKRSYTASFVKARDSSPDTTTPVLSPTYVTLPPDETKNLMTKELVMSPAVSALPGVDSHTKAIASTLEKYSNTYKPSDRRPSTTRLSGDRRGLGSGGGRMPQTVSPSRFLNHTQDRVLKTSVARENISEKDIELLKILAPMVPLVTDPRLYEVIQGTIINILTDRLQ
ncbi:VP10 [Kundal virus]|uniref:VP10 n=1 Tax=Kundal virus TaxID=2290890 RepID=A0A499RSH8_9REOV|nr:VP10 [Kundal virus]AXG65503.1 VP10 [Kundal virus]